METSAHIAIRLCQNATRKTRRHSCNLGNALLQSGDKTGAEQAFREAIRLLPKVPQLRENLRRLQ